jgi:putative membrane protein
MIQKLREISLKAKVNIAVATVLAVLSLIVILQNTAPVETKILFMTITMPRAGLLAVTLLIGVVSGILLTLGWSAKRTKRKAE